MRGPDGLVWDSAEVVNGRPAKLKPIHPDTTPTNIGLDLLVQTGVGARKNVARIVRTLGELPKYADKGLFFARYSTSDPRAVDPRYLDVSSVDNINLAIAIWTAAQTFSGDDVGLQARSLFDRMEFSPFYHSKDGLVAGSLRYDPKTRSWAPAAWTYGDFGSEARSLYTAGFALGVFKELPRAIDALHMELFPSSHGNILRVWDGGIFQELLPALLLDEPTYSTEIAESAAALGSYLREVGGKFPAAYSASQTGVETYNGQQGVLRLATTLNPAVCVPEQAAVWQSVFTTHAAMLAAAMSDPDEYAPAFQALSSYTDGARSMYNKGIGFSDGLYVAKAPGHREGEIIPVVLSLDKGMEALSLLRILDPSGLGPSAAAFAADPVARARLSAAYRLVDRKLSALTPTASFCGR
jgi:hypothetical protein